MMSRTLAIMRKEFLHVSRDPRALAVMFLIPLVWLFLLGYAANTDVEHVATAVLDQDRTAESRELVTGYHNSNAFDIVRYVGSQAELTWLIDSGQVTAGIIIPTGYSQDLARGKQAQIRFVVDGSNPVVANAAYSAAQLIGQSRSIEIGRERLGVDPADQPGLDVRARVWYNPNLRSENFTMPGVIGVIFQQLGIMLTAMAIVREREQGTIEQLIVTPIRPVELIVGKIVPYLIIAFVDLIEVLVLSTLLFHVPIHGSISLLVSLSMVFLVTTLSMGLFVSTVAKTQQEAMLLTLFIVLPSIFLSGYFFPIESMPIVLQYASKLIPLTYAIAIVRGIIVKGIGLEMLLDEVITLGLISVVLLVLAAIRFRKRLE